MDRHSWHLSIASAPGAVDAEHRLPMHLECNCSLPMPSLASCCYSTPARQRASAPAASDPNTAPLHEVLTPLDEVAFWEELATSSAAAGSPAQPAAQQVRHVQLLFA